MNFVLIIRTFLTTYREVSGVVNSVLACQDYRASRMFLDVLLSLFCTKYNG